MSDEREREINAPAAAVYHAICGIGGERGWFAGDWLWSVRGVADKLVGGPGMRRGRRHQQILRVGDELDFWRVQAIEPSSLLRLRAEMRLPGVAGLEWQVEELAETGSGPRSLLRQTATFVPRGLWGRVYWYGVLPFHRFVFPGMLEGIATDAERRAAAPESGPARDGSR